MAAREEGVVLVTGAAGAIGAATADALAVAGYTVVGFDRTRRDTTHAQVVVDVTDDEAVADAVASVREVGALRHLISVAGGALPSEPESKDDPARVDPAVFRQSVELNLTSHFLVLRAALPWLRQRPAGDASVTLTSSFNAFSAQGMPAYSAAKAGLIGLMNALVDPLGAEGIRINVVAPGTIRTPRTERLWGDSSGHFERLERGTALQRLGTPDDVAASFVSLVELTHVTGQVLFVDGGKTRIHR